MIWKTASFRDCKVNYVDEGGSTYVLEIRSKCSLKKLESVLYTKIQLNSIQSLTGFTAK